MLSITFLTLSNKTIAYCFMFINEAQQGDIDIDIFLQKKGNIDI